MISGLVLTRKPLLDDIARWLGPVAETTVVITSEGPPLAAEAGFRHVCRLPDYNAPEVGMLIADLARRFGVTRIGSLNEVDVLRAAAARSLLDLPGQGMSSAVAFRDKYMMKSLAATAGVPVPGMRRAADLPGALSAGGELRYPLVVKPVGGGGSVGVRVICGPSDWESVAGPWPMLVEEKVDEVDFYVVDGLMRDGAPTLHVPLRTGVGNFAYVDAGVPAAGYSVPRTEPLYTELTAFTRQVLGALPPVAEETAFHLEIFREREGGLVLCEIAARSGGIGHAPTFHAVTGVELNGASLRGQLGLGPRVSNPERVCEGGFAAFPRIGGLLCTQPDSLNHPMVSSYRVSAEVGRRYERSRWVGDNAALALVRAPVGTGMREVMDEVIGDYHARTKWS